MRSHQIDSLISTKISAYIGHNTSYWQSIGQQKYICIGIGRRYVGANISVSEIRNGWTHISPTIEEDEWYSHGGIQGKLETPSLHNCYWWSTLRYTSLSSLILQVRLHQYYVVMTITFLQASTTRPSQTLLVWTWRYCPPAITWSCHAEHLGCGATFSQDLLGCFPSIS